MQEHLAFLSIERSLGRLAWAALEPSVSDVRGRIKTAFDRRDYAAAHDVIPHINFHDAGVAVSKHAENYARSAYLLGASAVHGGLRNLPRSVGKRMPERLIANAVRVHSAIVSKRAEILVRQALGKLIAHQQAGHHESGFGGDFSRGSKLRVGKSDLIVFKDDVADMLNAAVDGTAKMMASISANLTTSRLVSFGFLSEAADSGVLRYKLQAVMDDKTSDICISLDGREFEVQQSLDYMQRVLETVDPESLKIISPFVSGSASSIDRMDGMTDEELQAAGIMVPPFHVHCRTILVLVGTPQVMAPDIVPALEEEVPIVAEAEPFVGEPIPPEDIPVASPLDVATDQITGMSIEEIKDQLPTIVSQLADSSVELDAGLLGEVTTVADMSDGEVMDLIDRLGLGTVSEKSEEKVVRKFVMDAHGHLHGPDGKFMGKFVSNQSSVDYAAKGKYVGLFEYVKESPTEHIAITPEGKKKYFNKNKYHMVTKPIDENNPKGAKVIEVHHAVAVTGSKPLPSQLQPTAAQPEAMNIVAQAFSGVGAKPITAPGVNPDISSWTKVGDQKGSNPGGTYKDHNGEFWYVKTPKSESHADNEVLANRLYGLAKVSVPVVIKAQMDGATVVASKIVEGADTLGKAQKFADASTWNNLKGKAQEGFGVDAWLANWDSVGTGKDNMLVDGAMDIVRIDQGGSLMYRAQGGLKGNSFGEKVGEVQSLRDAALNKDSHDIFGSMTNKELIASLSKVASILPSNISDIVDKYGPGTTSEKNQLYFKLLARRADITEQIVALQKAAVEEAKPKKELFESLPEKIRVPGDPTSKEKSAIRHYTGGSYRAINEALRGGAMDGQMWDEQVKPAINGLKKLPGRRGISWRETDVPAEVSAKYKVGTVIEEHGFLSTSKKESFSWGGSVRYSVHGATGVDLNAHDLSIHESENEVLFRPGTRFKIAKIEQKGKQKHVTLVEMLAHDN